MIVNPEEYQNLFVENKQGEKILQELTALFYDRPSYTKNDPYDTAYKEGQRATVEFILRKTSQIQIKENEE